MPTLPVARTFDIYLGQPLVMRLEFWETYRDNIENYKKFHALFENNSFDRNTTILFAELIKELDEAALMGLIVDMDIITILNGLFELGHAAVKLDAQEVEKIKSEWLNRIMLQPRIRSVCDKLSIASLGMLLGLSIGLVTLAGILIAMTGIILAPSIISTILVGGIFLGLRVPGYPLKGAVAGFVVGLLVVAAITVITQGAALPLMALVIPLVLAAILGAYAAHRYFECKNAAEPVIHGERINEKSNALARNIHSFFASKEAAGEVKTDWSIVREGLLTPV